METNLVTPWYNTQEWVQVYHSVKSNRLAQITYATEHIKIWQSRSDRLPAGKPLVALLDFHRLIMYLQPKLLRINTLHLLQVFLRTLMWYGLCLNLPES